jgi:poly-gamma-glutamate capsule biosynthesis protein CapA/YwtB (metallophosphatase superfamily)
MMRTRHTVMLLVCGMACATTYFHATTNVYDRVSRQVSRRAASHEASLLAFGDVNLGRSLGQVILAAGSRYPFEKFVRDSADIYFVNLESTLSEQHGETESPESNYIFTGPPLGAEALALAGITCVATANNHAYDYGERAMRETIENLDKVNIAHCGSAQETANVFEPLWIEKNGIRFAFFAVTDFMNAGKQWREHVASTDTAKLFPKLREAAGCADAVVISIHGGDEYADVPSGRMNRFMHACLSQGVAVVLGHHPHVPYGIEEIKGRYIVSSLGNFVFHQPQNEWTQLSYGVVFQFSKKAAATSVRLKEIIPVAVGFQPMQIIDADVRGKLLARVQKYSTISLTQFH